MKMKLTEARKVVAEVWASDWTSHEGASDISHYRDLAKRIRVNLPSEVVVINEPKLGQGHNETAYVSSGDSERVIRDGDWTIAADWSARFWNLDVVGRFVASHKRLGVVFGHLSDNVFADDEAAWDRFKRDIDFVIIDNDDPFD